MTKDAEPDTVEGVEGLVPDEAIRGSDREYLSQGFIVTLAAAMIASGWLWGSLLIATQGVHPILAPWWPPVILMATGYFCRRFHEERFGLSAIVMFVGQVAAVCLAIAIYGYHEFGYALVVPVLVSGVISGRWGVAGAVSAALAIVVGLFPLLDLAPRVIRTLLIVLLAAAGLAWMFAHYIHVALELSWQSRQRALAEMHKARIRRAELGRANRALDDSNIRLQRLNRELLLMRRQAEEARMLKEEFAANVSHELRTPINLVVGFSEMMVTSPESYGRETLPSTYMGDVRAIHRSSRHLQSLIDDILNIARIDARQMELHREKTAPDEMVSEACDVVRGYVERKGLALQMLVASSLPDLHVDRTRIRQVLLNLISNSARFTDQGSITVSCRMYDPRRRPTARPGAVLVGDMPLDDNENPSAYVYISVRDTGTGFQAKDASKIFEKFRQLDGTTRRRHGGTGLGLAISKQFVELHGGRMWAESVPGQGSVFSFILPVAVDGRAQPSMVDTGPLGEVAPPKSTLLVVDQDPRASRLLQRHLPDVHVEAIQRSEDVPGALAARMPDLVLVSDGRGCDPIWWQSESDDPLQKAHVTVLEGDLQIERHATQDEWTDVLLKPVSREQLIGSIERVDETVSTILVVEDNPDVSRLIVRFLNSWRTDLTVVRAFSAQDCRRMMMQRQPDLILLDLSLPDGDGYKLQNWIMREKAASVPVIAIAGDAAAQMADAARMKRLSICHADGFDAREFLGLLQVLARQVPSRYVLRDGTGNRATEKSGGSMRQLR